jgi:ribosomal protein S18 acetylase RimI-like enzyme
LGPLAGIDQRRKAARGLDVRPARRNDLPMIAALDQHQFGTHTVDESGLEEWWRRYRLGAYVLEAEAPGGERKIIGAIGIWPITKDTYTAIIRGKLKESDITADCITPIRGRTRHRHWYLADIVVDRRFRDRSLRLTRFAELLTSATRQWLDSGHIADEVRLCAIVTPDPHSKATEDNYPGAKLLSKLGFERAASRSGKLFSPDGMPIYLLSVTRSHIEAVYLDRIRPDAASAWRGYWLAQVTRAAVALSASVAVLAVTILVANRFPGVASGIAAIGPYVRRHIASSCNRLDLQ